MTDKPTIYLGGPIRKHPDGGKMWRSRVIGQYGQYFDFRNPLDRYDVPNDDLTVVDRDATEIDDPRVVSVDQIVEGDKTDIHASDALFVGYSDVKSIGTPMEVMFAYDRNMPIVVCLMDGSAKEDLSPWYRYHTDAITHTQSQALVELEELLDEKQVLRG